MLFCNVLSIFFLAQFFCGGQIVTMRNQLTGNDVLSFREPEHRYEAKGLKDLLELQGLYGEDDPRVEQFKLKLEQGFVGNLYLDEQSIDELHERFPKLNLTGDITIDQYMYELAKLDKSEGVLGGEENKGYLAGRLLSQDFYYGTLGLYYGADSGKICSMIWEKAEHKLALEEAEEAANFAKSKKAGKLARKQQNAREDFFREALDVPGQMEYRLKYYRGSEYNLIPGKTTVDNCLRQIATNSVNGYQETPGDNPAATILRNMATGYNGTSAMKYSKYFGGTKPLITQQVIEERLNRMKQELASHEVSQEPKMVERAGAVA